MRIAQEEIFGPTLSLIRFRDEAEAIRISNGIRYGLSSSIFTRDVNRAFRAMRDLEAGITYINAGTIGAEVHLPFGGTKETGNGHREAGQAALDVFTEWKSVYVDYSGTLQRAQIDNARVSRRVKLVWFVPEEALDATRDAVFEAGAGRIGDYERCSWYAAGTGTFLGGEGTSPALGESGREERVAELRVETVVPEGRIRDAIVALRARAPVRGAGVRRLPAARPVKAKLFTDGGSRGNPGPAAYAFVLEAEDGTVLDARGEAIGVATNNVAEYSALVAGLERAVEVGVDELEVVSDSELLVKQMRGEYRVKNRALQDLFLDASRLARKIHRVTYTAVRREHNELADSLVNEALDAAARERIARIPMADRHHVRIEYCVP